MTRLVYGARGSSRLLTPSQCTTGTPIWVSEYLTACCSSLHTRLARVEILLPSCAGLGVEHVDDEHAEAALSQIAQGLDETRVQQRAEHDDQRAWRQGSSR